VVSCSNSQRTIQLANWGSLELFGKERQETNSEDEEIKAKTLQCTNLGLYAQISFSRKVKFTAVAQPANLLFGRISHTKLDFLARIGS
jgi:hypothetical protein